MASQKNPVMFSFDADKKETYVVKIPPHRRFEVDYLMATSPDLGCVVLDIILGGVNGQLTFPANGVVNQPNENGTPTDYHIAGYRTKFSCEGSLNVRLIAPKTGKKTSGPVVLCGSLSS